MNVIKLIRQVLGLSRANDAVLCFLQYYYDTLESIHRGYRMILAQITLLSVLQNSSFSRHEKSNLTSRAIVLIWNAIFCAEWLFICFLHHFLYEEGICLINEHWKSFLILRKSLIFNIWSNVALGPHFLKHLARGI